MVKKIKRIIDMEIHETFFPKPGTSEYRGGSNAYLLSTVRSAPNKRTQAARKANVLFEVAFFLLTTLLKSYSYLLIDLTLFILVILLPKVFCEMLCGSQSVFSNLNLVAEIPTHNVKPYQNLMISVWTVFQDA